MFEVINELGRYWLEGASRAAEGVLRTLRDPYPVDGEPAGATAFETIYQGEKLKLRHYPGNGAGPRTPLLVVYALIKRPFILDLLPGRSVVETLTRSGLDVYLTDWIPPTREDSWRGFDDYVNCELHDAVRAVQRRSGSAQLDMLGYCFGGVLSLMWTALYPETVKNLVTLATPVDARIPNSPLFAVAGRLSEAVEPLIEMYGNCPGWFINACFKSMAPVHHALSKYVDLYRNREGEGYSEMFRLFERWMDSDVPMTGAIFREVTEQLFRHNLLMRSEFRIGGTRVDLKNITCPLLNVIGEYDDVVPPRSSVALEEATASRDWSNLRYPAGHVGTAVSGGAQRKLWPQVAQWLASHN
ncbi:MAG TPA: alpha/beta fold hydrolase [Candidatus Binataceae bacterium]|jgi:polyhydroxyalkanoate synthase|nr:alpha/beta fold hydrolase [Candidatus Binataceae bacterium]